MFGNRKSALARGSALTVLAGLAFGGPAFAQDQTPPAPAPTTEVAEEETVVVTGSRLRRNEFTSSSPILVITNEQSALEGTIDTAELLQGSSVASGSQQINNQFTGFVTEGGNGTNSLSLRGLGANRTLILLNGRRLNPAGTRGQVGSVDLNVIPESMIDRIEILKDGASSIYGSDAVAGVVNVILDTDLDGGQINAQYNAPFEGGGESYQIDGAWGHAFDRGHIMAAFEYFNRTALNWGERDYLNCAQDLVYDGGPEGDLLDIIDPATGESKCFNQLNNVYDRVGGAGGRFIANPNATAGGGPFGVDLAGFQRVGLSYAQVASVMPGAPQADIEAAWRENNAIVPNNPVAFGARNAITPVERLTLMATGSFDITSGTELYGEVMVNRRESSSESYRQLFPTVSGSNPYNPFGQSARSIITVPTGSDQSIDWYRSVIGLRGDIGFLDTWSYDVYAQLGKSDAEYGTPIILNDRVLATTGAAACNPALITISDNSVCTPVNYFDPTTVATGQFTQAERDFLFLREIGTTEYTQQVFSGTITGDLFDLPAGTVALALGAEWRKEELDDSPGFNTRNGNLWGQTSSGRTAGDDTTTEYFGEIEVPLLANQPLFENLALNASYRFTETESYGENDTYKVGLNWQVTPEYRFRVTHGTSFRAPELYELYLANQTGFLAQTSIDPCINWDDGTASPFIVQNCGPSGANLPPGYTATGYSSALIVTGGGAGILNAETSQATVYGFIWTPNFIDLSVAFDYFNIEVFDQVAQFGAANIAGACYSDPDYNTSPFCTLVDRDLTPGSPTYGMINQINDSYVNLNSQITEGLDLT